ncbi:XrtB/PEP-CTERM-associated polysaccharide biosynthesis outer membrane protein EpsL [Herminiimonas fonticola]|uniref:XrtB/PEP-CTERM-associated polysaccharide biosynthesis outer membrane protein EpsL n=1 Tax=Herminiimonas fonticola TaxID=303380 RepID=UPI00333E2FCA
MNHGRENPVAGSYVLVLLAGALTCVSAQAAEESAAVDTFTPYVTFGAYYDANLLRQPEAAKQSGAALSDRWTRAAIGLRMDKELGRQRLTADLSANHSEYDRFNQFSNDGKDLLANWKWVAGNQFSGNVGTSYSEGLTPFDDYRSFERSIRTQRKNYVDGSWRFHPSWQLNAAYNRFDLRYDTQAQNPSERNLDMTDIGIDYLAKSGNKVGLVARHIEGRYPYADINSYDQNELKAKVDWQLTGKTYLQFLGGWAKREYAANPQRDSSVPSARLTAYWKATGKTAFSLGVWRELGATDDLAANYARNQGVSVGSTWDASSKISVDGLIMTEKRDYNGVAVIQGIAPSDRDDRYRNAMLGVTYKPTTHLRVRASVYRTTLDSNIAEASYRTNGIQINTRYEF